MITLIILALIVLIVGIAAVLLLSTLGAGAIIVCGDWIIAIAVILWIMWRIIKKMFD